MYYINDKVKDDFNKQDFFGGEKYSNELEESILNKDIKSVGIYGKWGIGKTSIVNNAINNLVIKRIYDKNNIIKYNAWKYSGFEFMRDFLIICSEKIETEGKSREREESYYSDRAEDEQRYEMTFLHFKKFLKTSWKFLLFLAILWIIGVVIIVFINNHVNRNWYDCADIIGPYTVALVSFVLPTFLVSEMTHKSLDRKFSPEQFARDFKEIIGNKKVLIFIDDIDRCDSKEILSTLSTLKTFILEEDLNVKFIIPIDQSVLYKELGGQTFDYLSKIIDYSIEIREYTDSNYELLNEEILSKVKKDYIEIVRDGLYVASKIYNTPRKIKKFANEFINFIYRHPSNELKGKGYKLAKLLIIKNDFPNYYELLIADYKETIEETNEKLYPSDYSKNEEIYSNELLTFLRKTSDITLEDYPLFEYNMTYDEFRIKRICEDPHISNSLGNNSIDLKANKRCLDYEINENIIKPLKDGKLLMGNKFESIMLIVKEFMDQKNSGVFEQYYQEIVNFFENIVDNNMTKTEAIDGVSWKIINIEYIINSIKPYLDLIKSKENNISNDQLLSKIIHFIANENCLDDSIKIHLDEIIDFLNVFSSDMNIENKELIGLIDKVLNENFNKNYEKLSWYFENNATSGNICYVEKIIDYLNEHDDSKGAINQYLKTRYKTHGINTYIQQLTGKMDLIKMQPDKYVNLLNPLIERLKEVKASQEKLEDLILKLKPINENDLLDKLYLNLVACYKKSSNDTEKYNEYLKSIGIEYNKKEEYHQEFEWFLDSRPEEDKEIILGYDNDNNRFNNFNVLKNTKIDLSSNNDKYLATVANTYCENESFIIKNDIDRHNLVIDENRQSIKELINSNINTMIYLAEDFNKEQLNDLDLADLDINQLDLECIKNNTLIKLITKKVNVTIEESLEKMNNDKDNLNLVKEETKNIIENLEKIYAELNVPDYQMWSKLKKLEFFINYHQVLDSFYIPLLNQHEKLLRTIKESKYLNKYKDSITSINKIVD